MAQEPDDDFEGEGEPEFEGGGGGGSNKKKLLLLVVLPLVLVIGGGAVAYFTGLADPVIAMITGKKNADAAAADAGGDAGKDAAADKGKDDGGKDKKGKEKKEAKAGEGGKGGEGAAGGANAVFYDLPEMLVNINTAGRKRNFLKLRVSLELANEADINMVENVLPRIVDNFQVYLRELRLEDLQGAAGMFRLREELLTRVNAAVRPAQVKDVLFKEMIVQ
jgi:flagellar FliL protein